MKKRLFIIIIVVLVIAGGAVTWWWRSRGADDKLVLSGTIEARDVEVGSLIGGRILKVGIEEGQRVEAGQMIVLLDPELVDGQIREQAGAVAATEAARHRAENGPRREEIEKARVEWDVAERERARLEPLVAQGIVTAQQYDDAAARAAAALATYQQLQRGSRPEDIAEARANVEQAQGRLAYLKRTREETVVTSPAAGVIESFDLRPGDLVQPNQPVARILEPGQLWVRVYVPEPKLGLVRLGQEARVTVDTFPHREFRGRVAEIRDRAEYVPRNIQTLEQRNDQVFGVKVLIDPAPELKAGMAAFVRVEPAGESLTRRVSP